MPEDQSTSSAEDQLRGRYSVPLPVIRPIPARALLAGVSAVFFLTALFGFYAEYGRKELVSASITPRGGEARLSSTGATTVRSIHVRPGESVSAGATLLEFSASPLPEQSSTEAKQDARREMADIKARLLRLEGTRSPRQGATQQLSSPIDGTVTAIPVSAGESLAAGQLVAVVTPKDAPAEIALMVPASSVAAIRVGREVSLRLDAYPFESFGYVDAVVRSVDLTPTASTKDGKPLVRAYAQVLRVPPRINLQAGMTGVAAVEVERRTLLAWLLWPLLKNFLG